MDQAELEPLLEYTDAWVRARISGEKPPPEPEGRIAQAEFGLFVTLSVDSELRGCIGSIEPRGKAAWLCRRMAEQALADHRFADSRVQPDELPCLSVELTILSPAFAIQDLSEMVVGKHGIVVQIGNTRGVFLPQVAVERAWTPLQAAEQCCVMKLGMDRDAWKREGAQLFLFEGTKLCR